MSYILEALKKVEQKHEQEEPSRVPTFSSEQVQDDRKALVWPYVVAAALLLNAALALWLFGPWRAHEQPSPLSTSVEPQPSLSTPPVRSEDGLRGPAASAKTVVNRETPSKDVDKQRAPRVRQQKEAEMAASVVRQQKEAETTPLPAAPKVPISPAGVPEDVQVRVEKPQPIATHGKVVSLSELPSSIRGSLPEFRVSGHAYGPDAETRVVRINEKILQEGQNLSPGLKVEEIVPDGIVLSYGGYLFHIGVKENR